MKKLLCYLGIFVLLGLALMPPILRITLPKEKEEEKVQVITSKLLSCQNDELIIKESYENDNVKMLVMKKLLLEVDEDNENSEDDKNTEENKSFEYTKSKELISLFDSIKDNGNIIYNKLEDGEVISIDFSLSDHKDLNINTLTQSIESQKVLYENQNLSCDIK